MVTDTNRYAQGDRTTAGNISHRIDSITWDFIEILIEYKWSPEQIHGWMKENLKDSTIAGLYAVMKCRHGLWSECRKYYQMVYVVFESR